VEISSAGFRILMSRMHLFIAGHVRVGGRV
jgi:hypothetical protein